MKLGKEFMNKISSTIKYKSSPTKERNTRAKINNGWTEKFNRKLQKQTSPYRRISDLEDNTVWNYPASREKEKSKESQWDLRDTIKRNNICIMEVPDGEEHEKRTASIFKAIIAKNFPKRSGHPDSWSPKDSK